MLRARQTTKSGRHTSSAVALKRAKNNIRKQALLAALVVFLTVIILFAITAAWYTNIAQTSGLVFEAETWGFEGTVDLGTTNVLKAAPGEEGIVSLTAENTGNTTAAVGVNVNKAKMDEEMQKRIYFYVDAAKTVNGEQVDRVYLNSAMNYTYTLFSGDTLTLTEDVSNDSLIKWHWVYDVLGYYVKGSFSGSTFVAEEYVRPIEYAFDEANTTFEVVTNAAGKKEYAGLSTIDGKITAEEFIVEFSKHDGYEGEIDPDNTGVVNGYYPIAVDRETGRGIWAYMCSYSEIYMNTQYDTKLGQEAAAAIADGKAPASYEAVITLSAQNTEIETTDVDTANALLTVFENAKTSGETAYIKLNSSISLSDNVVFESKENIVIDLNGNTLTVPMATYSEHNAGIQLLEGSSLTIYNGTVSGEEPGGIAVYTQGGILNMRGVTMDNVETAVYVRDDWGDQGGDSRIKISGCTLICSEEGVYLSGNGAASARTTQLVVENSTISSNYIGIMGNGNDTQWGTDVQIINSVVSGYYAGVYQPQRNSTLTVSGDGTQINGYNGLVLKAGSATIYGGSIVGTGDANPPTSMLGSGYNDTGDGIYIETNYPHDISLEIYGGVIAAVDDEHGALALRVFEEDAENVSVKIYGGDFNTEVNPAYYAELPVEETPEEDVQEEDPPESNDSGDAGTDTQPEGGSDEQSPEGGEGEGGQTGEPPAKEETGETGENTNNEEGGDVTA